MTEKTYQITIVVKSEEFDASEILDAVHEEIGTGFLADLDAEIDGEEVAVEPVRAGVARGMSDAIEKYAAHIRISVLQEEIRTLRAEIDTVKKERDEAGVLPWEDEG